MCSWWVTMWSPMGWSCTTPGCFSPLSQHCFLFLGFLFIFFQAFLFMWREKRRGGRRKTPAFLSCFILSSYSGISPQWTLSHWHDSRFISLWLLNGGSPPLPGGTHCMCHLLPFQSHIYWSSHQCKKWSHYVTPQWGTETWHRGFVFPVCQLPPKKCHLKRGSLLTTPCGMEQANSSCDLPTMLLLFPGLEVLLAWQMLNVNMLCIHPSCHYLGEVRLESRKNCEFGLVQLQEWNLRGHKVITPKFSFTTSTHPFPSLHLRVQICPPVTFAFDDIRWCPSRTPLSNPKVWKADAT